MSIISTSITYDDVSSLIFMKVRGIATAQDVTNAYELASEYANKHEASKVLLDVTELEHRFSAKEVASVLPELAKKLEGLSIARVVELDGFMHSLFADKIRQLNVDVRNFECYKLAQQWLSK